MSDYDDDYQSLGNVTITRETDKAILVMDAELESYWVPKSCIHPGSAVFHQDDSGELIVDGWWARKEGRA